MDHVAMTHSVAATLFSLFTEAAFTSELDMDQVAVPGQEPLLTGVYHCKIWLQDAQLSQRDRAAGCII